MKQIQHEIPTFHFRSNKKDVLPSREITYPLFKALLKMIFLFSRWDMLVSEKVYKTSTSWWFQTIWKIFIKLDHFPKFQGESKEHLKPPIATLTPQRINMEHNHGALVQIIFPPFHGWFVGEPAVHLPGCFFVGPWDHWRVGSSTPSFRPPWFSPHDIPVSHLIHQVKI